MIEFKTLDISNWDAVKQIYEQGIATGNATFQTSSQEWFDWDKSHISHSRIVPIENDKVIGWAALTPVSDRCVYAGVAEVSVYVGSKSRGKGIGKKLLLQLIEHSETENVWTLQAGIFPENMISIKLHEGCGFRVIGRRERIGKMGGVWRDAILMERRSNKIGL